MNNIILTALSVCLSFSVFPLSSSENKTYNTTVTVDYATQRYLNDVSHLTEVNISIYTHLKILIQMSGNFLQITV